MQRARSLSVLIATLAACGPGALAVPEPRELTVPAAPGAGQPFVGRWADGIVASWTEPDGTGHALRFARWDGEAWSQPGTIARGDGWFVNWADFPSVLALSDRDLAAHWLQRSGRGTYAYDVMLTRSGDAGDTWSDPFRPHRDGTETEHGFATLFPFDGGVGVVWLDGRMYAGGAHGDSTGEMTVRFTSIPATGPPGPEILLDGRACDCCQTAVALADGGPVVFYRDRSPDEVRDIVVTRLTGGAWTPPTPVHADGWVIGGCPVNGPAADADGADVAVAWFTAAGEAPRVQVAFSRDAGATFGPPVRVDDGDGAGRVDLLLMPAGPAFVVWLENVRDGAELRGRLVAADGTVGPSRRLAATSATRASGFPRMARAADDVVLLWTEPGDPSRIRGAVLAF